MEKLFRYICAVLLIVTVGTACQKPEYVAPNNQAGIQDFYATLEGDGRSRLFESTISNDTVYVHVDYYYPIDSDYEVDLKKLLLKASIPVDSRIEPSLEGLTDLTNPLPIQVIAGDGSVKKYVIVASKKGNTDVYSATLTYEDVTGATEEVDAIIMGNNINFSLVPGTVLKNPRLSYTLNKHAQGSIEVGGIINLDQPSSFTVTSAGDARKVYTLQSIVAKKLAKGIRPGSAKIMFAKKLKGDIGISVDNLTGGIAATGQYLVLNTRDQNSIVLNGQTGAKIGEIDLGPIRGGLRNFYSTADDGGNILVNNLTPNDGNTFNIWKISSITGSPESFISWNAGGSSYGRKVSVIGDINKDAIITAPLYGLASINVFARWQVKAGQLVSQTPTMVTTTGFTWTWNNADVIYTDPTSLNSEYYIVGYAGNKLTQMNGGTNTVMAAMNALDGNFICNAVDFLSFNNGKYVAYTHLNSFNWGSADQAFLINAEAGLAGDPNTSAATIWLAPKGTYGPSAAQGPTNANATADVALAQSANGYFMYMYFMFTNGYVVGVQFDCIDL